MEFLSWILGRVKSSIPPSLKAEQMANSGAKQLRIHTNLTIPFEKHSFLSILDSTIKLSNILPEFFTLLAANQTLACIHSKGTITYDFLMGWTIFPEFADNKFKPYDGGNVHQDKSRVWIMDCKPGYHLTFSKTGNEANDSYRNQHLQWRQNVEE
jgi:hypothetical protein